VEAGRNCHGFYRRIAKDSIKTQFHLGNCGSTDQGGSLYTCQDHLLRATTSRAIYVKDSLSPSCAKEDCGENEGERWPEMAAVDEAPSVEMAHGVGWLWGLFTVASSR
jgi:hypothetical protein